MSNPNAIYSSDFYKEYTTAGLTGTLNLITESQDASGNTAGSPCRAIQNVGAAQGNISVLMARGNLPMTLTFAAGELKTIQANAIVIAMTTVTVFDVYW